MCIKQCDGGFRFAGTRQFVAAGRVVDVRCERRNAVHRWRGVFITNLNGFGGRSAIAGIVGAGSGDGIAVDEIRIDVRDAPDTSRIGGCGNGNTVAIQQRVIVFVKQRNGSVRFGGTRQGIAIIGVVDVWRGSAGVDPNDFGSGRTVAGTIGADGRDHGSVEQIHIDVDDGPVALAVNDGRDGVAVGINQRSTLFVEQLDGRSNFARSR